METEDYERAEVGDIVKLGLRNAATFNWQSHHTITEDQIKKYPYINSLEGREFEILRKAENECLEISCLDEEPAIKLMCNRIYVFDLSKERKPKSLGCQCDLFLAGCKCGVFKKEMEAAGKHFNKAFKIWY